MRPEHAIPDDFELHIGKPPLPATIQGDNPRGMGRKPSPLRQAMQELTRGRFIKVPGPMTSRSNRYMSVARMMSGVRINYPHLRMYRTKEFDLIICHDVDIPKGVKAETSEPKPASKEQEKAVIEQPSELRIRKEFDFFDV